MSKDYQDDLRAAINTVVAAWSAGAGFDVTDAILALPEMQRLEADAVGWQWMVERLRHAARPCGADEEMNEAEQAEQAFARSILAIAYKEEGAP